MQNIIDIQYQNLLKEILTKGEVKSDRTGTGTISLFSPTDLRIDMSQGLFPLLTCRFIPNKSILHESIWMFCQGSTDITYLQKNNVKIWNEWAVNNKLGPIYGSNFRAFQGHRKEVPEYVDQLQLIISSLIHNKNSRRHVISGWNPSTAPIESLSFEDNYNLGRSVLPQCHGVLIQFYVSNNNELSMKYYIRSSDTILGLPANCQNAALLMLMVSQVTGYKPKDLIISFGDAHIYSDHVEGAQELVQREIIYNSPIIQLNENITDIDSFTISDFTINNYQHLEKMYFKVSV